MQILVRADRYFSNHDYEKAKIEYLNLLKLERNNPHAIQRLGLIWSEEGAPLEAYVYLSRAQELVPSDLEIRMKLSTIMADLGETEAAYQKAAEVLDESPGQEEALIVLARTASSEAEFEEVREQLRRIPEEDDITYHLAWANLAIRERNLAYAESELERADRLRPGSPRTHLTLANVYVMKGNLDNADKEFQTACTLSPVRSPARLQYAQFLIQIGRQQEAVAFLRETTRLASDYFPAWCLLAEDALSQKKYDEAFALLKNVLSRDSQNLNGLLLTGEVWLGRGESEKAVALFEALGFAYPKVPLVNYQLARAYFANQDLFQAAVAVNEALAVKPDYTDAILLQAKVYLAQNKPALVLPAMRALLKRNRNLIPARLLLVDAFTSMKQWNDAAATLADGIEAAPDWAEGHFRLGLVLRQLGKPDQAYRAFEQSNRLDPENDRALEQLVELDLLKHDYNRAIAKADQKIATLPGSSEGYWLRGKIFFAQKDWPGAETAARKAIDLNPQFFKALDLLVSIYFSTDRSGLGIATLEAFVSKNHSNVEALATLGQIYDETTDYSKAANTYQELLSISPDSAGALNNLAFLYAEHLDDPARAVELARKARALQPISAEIGDTLGWALFKNADYGEAVTVLRECVGPLAQNPNAQFHFGMASYMMGDSIGATKAFQAALGLRRDFSGRGEAENRLRFLQNNHEFSLERLKGCLQERPDDIIALICLAERNTKQHDFAAAAAAYEQALAINPELVPAALNLAELNLGPLENRNLAFAFGKRARDLAPADPRVANLLGRIVFQIGNFPWAYSLLSESARRLNDDPKALRDFAWSAYSVSKLDEAIRLMRRVLELHPDAATATQASTFLTMTTSEKSRERIPSLEGAIEQLLKADEFNIPALMAKAQLQQQRQDPATAIAIYHTVLERWPDFALAEKHLAALLIDDSNQINEAFELASRARNSLSDDAELGATLGEIGYKKNDFPYAIRCFQESARKRPLPTRDLYYLGMAQLKMSQDTEARKTLEKAISAGLQEPLSREAKNVLNDLAQRTGL